MADLDKILKILIQLGISGEDAAKAAKQIIEEIKTATDKVTEATDESTHAGLKNAESVGEQSLKHGELRKILMEIGNVAAPGAGHALSELAFGPVGAALALVGAYELVRREIEDSETQLDNFAAEAAKPMTGGIDALKTAWDNAAKALGTYYSQMATAGLDNDPVATQIKRAKELADAETEASKKIVAAQGEIAVARLRAAGASQAQIDAAEKQTRAQLAELDKQHEHAVGSSALKKEQEDRLAQNAQLQREANAALDAQRAADKKFTDKQAEIGNLRGQLDPNSETGKDLAKRIKDANDKVQKAGNLPEGFDAENNIDLSKIRAGAMSEAQMELDAANRELESKKNRLDQLEKELHVQEQLKSEADDDAVRKTEASKINQARLRQLPGEIDQSQKVESAKDTGESKSTEITNQAKALKRITDSGESVDEVYQKGVAAIRQLVDLKNSGGDIRTIESEGSTALGRAAHGEKLSPADVHKVELLNLLHQRQQEIQTLREMLGGLGQSGNAMIAALATSRDLHHTTIAQIQAIHGQMAASKMQMESASTFNHR